MLDHDVFSTKHNPFSKLMEDFGEIVGMEIISIYQIFSPL